MTKFLSYPKGKAIVLSLLSSILAIASCENHNSMYDSTKAIGNVVLSDGKIVSPTYFNPDGLMPVGVIFHVKGDTAFVVALDDIGQLPFSVDTVDISGVGTNVYALDGFENTATIINSNANAEAANAAASWGGTPSGWYLPSAGELLALARNVATVERSLQLVNGECLANGEYVSSTQDGSSTAGGMFYCYCVNPHSGFVTSSLKTTPHHARAVMRFH